MGLIEPTIEEYLKWLRSELRLAFLLNTGRRLHATPTKDNPYLKLLYFDIIDELDLDPESELGAPKIGTLIKFLCKEDQTDFDPTTIMVFENYVFAVNKKYHKSVEPSNNTFKSISTYNGAMVINSFFRDNLKDNDKDLTHEDFYLGNTTDDCQWYGIVRNWDYIREKHNEVKEQVINCFKINSPVNAVILGTSGCGKSTFLRRLAIECIDEEFKILWVTDLAVFYQNELLNIRNDHKKYLLFVEDWTSLEKNISLTTNFLTLISNTKNIRLIISDKSFFDKGYLKYLVFNNKFELPSDENELILKKVLGLNPAWRELFNSISAVAPIGNCPLYLILFILARSNASSNKNNLSKIDDFLSCFIEIINKDLQSIYILNKGLALAINYCANFYLTSRFQVTWKSYLAITDFYNKENKTSSVILQISKDDPINKILKRYISLRPNLSIPLKEKLDYCYFHHDLLAFGLAQPLNETEYYNSVVLSEILKIIRNTGEIHWEGEGTPAGRFVELNEGQIAESLTKAGKAHLIADFKRYRDELKNKKEHRAYGIYRRLTKFIASIRRILERD